MLWSYISLTVTHQIVKLDCILSFQELKLSQLYTQELQAVATLLCQMAWWVKIDDIRGVGGHNSIANLS